MAQYEDEARDALLTEIRDHAHQADSAAELRLLAEAFALTVGNVAVSGVSTDRLVEVLAATGTRP